MFCFSDISFEVIGFKSYSVCSPNAPTQWSVMFIGNTKPPLKTISFVSNKAWHCPEVKFTTVNLRWRSLINSIYSKIRVVGVAFRCSGDLRTKSSYQRTWCIHTRLFSGFCHKRSWYFKMVVKINAHHWLIKVLSLDWPPRNRYSSPGKKSSWGLHE